MGCGRAVMSSENMKTVLIIKNLPSNYIEEAIFILRVNSKHVDKQLKGVYTYSDFKCNKDDKLIKEAQQIINNYIKRLEESEQIKVDSYEEKEEPHIKSFNIFLNISLIGSIAVLLFFILRYIL